MMNTAAQVVKNLIGESSNPIEETQTIIENTVTKPMKTTRTPTPAGP
jgi:hypothetical protein